MRQDEDGEPCHGVSILGTFDNHLQTLAGNFHFNS